MAAKQVLYHEEARQALLRGVNQLADAVKRVVETYGGVRYGKAGV